MQKDTKFLVCLVFAMASIAVHFWLSREIVLRSEPSLDGRKIAQISMQYNFPYFNPDGYLTVRKINGSIVERHHILTRDVASEILDGVQRITWSGERIVLFGNDQHYIGPDQYHPHAIAEAVEFHSKDAQ